jgi:hypothetical protein
MPHRKARPDAWGCRTCNRIDWADDSFMNAFPDHVSHRGFDIGQCKGIMIPLYFAPVEPDEEMDNG